MDIRKFYLQNAAGDRIDLNGVAGIYATDPTGLGRELSPTFGNLEHGFFSVLADAAEPQTAIGLTINFTRRRTAYEQYQDLVRWIAAAGDGLLLLYAPHGSTVYYRQVRLGYLRKTELGAGGVLSCPAAFRPLTPWYRPTEISADIRDVPAGALRYDQSRYDQGRYIGARAPSFSAVFQPEGDTPGTIELRFSGTATEPVITLTGQVTGRVYGVCAISASVLSGDELQYCSDPRDSYCRILRAGTYIPLDSVLDLTADPFFLMPLTEPCILTISGSPISGAARAYVSYFYSTV